MFRLSVTLWIIFLTMKLLFTTVILALICLPAFGQKNTNPLTGKYSESYVLVKLKSENKDIFSTSSKGGRVSAVIPGVQSTRHLIDDNLLFKNRTMNGPRIGDPSIDISLYYEVSCVKGADIQSFISQLNSTGLFDYVEPAYIHHLFITPNDPSISQQYYLPIIRAFEGWDISQGSENIVIGIVDTGADFQHSDLIDNLYSNPNDPNDGINNDGDAYFDDYRGWDFVGADTLNVINPNFLGDNNPSLTAGGDLAHGVSVAGCASGRANNGIGIAGVGYKSKLLFTKHTADNQNPSKVSIYRGFSGILYAASKGAKIINCSWGGSSKSQIEQDIINYVTNDLGSLVVAAAGNSGIAAPLYPASYDNVLSVAASDINNAKAGFSNYGSTVDLTAPGVNIFTTTYGNDYTTISGTSFSSPIVAGAAALVLAKNPTFTPRQISEQIRTTANSTLLYTKNPSFVNRLGKGLLDVYQALTSTGPSIRASNPKFVSSTGQVVQPGQKGFLTMTFNNILNSSTPALDITITSSTPYATIVKGNVKPGTIPGGGSISNTLTPFEVQIASSIPENTAAAITITYTDGTYSDYEVISFIINPSFIDVNQNLVSSTVCANGRIGFGDTESSTRKQGVGFNFDQNPMVYEMGLIMGSSVSALYNNVRGTNSYDQDFVSTVKINQSLPGLRSTSENSGSFSTSVTVAQQAVSVDYRSLVWKDSPYEKFFIMEYKIKNPTAVTINNFHFGIFSDWDITDNGVGDVAKWDGPNKMGYVYPAVASARPYGAIQLLTGTAEYFAIDNDQSVAGNPFGLYDGYTDAEKFQSISSGLGRLSAGTATAAGSDVSHVVSSGPYTIAAGQEITIAFALHAAFNLTDLQTSARYADSVYNYTLKAAVPTIVDSKVCYNTPATINATGATNYKWYKTFTGGTAFHTGAQFTTSNLLGDTTFYVSNSDHTYESVRTPAKVSVKANPAVSVSGSANLCQGQSITLSVGTADTFAWSNGATTQTITVSNAGNYSVTVTDASLSCQATSSPVAVVVNPNPVSNFSTSTGGELVSKAPITFTNQSTGAVSYLWDFGDSQTSTATSPAHTYTKGDNYTVTLTTYSDKGCPNVSTKSVSIITGLAESNSSVEFNTYPNPFTSNLYLKIDNSGKGPVSVRLVNTLGQAVYEAESEAGKTEVTLEIPGQQLTEGMYFVQVRKDNRMQMQKVIKMR